MAREVVPGLGEVDGNLGFEALVDGDYTADSAQCEKKTSSNGNLQYVITTKIVDGPIQTGGKSPKGRTLVDYITITENEFTIRRLKNACLAFNVKINKKDNSFNIDDFKDGSAIAEVYQELDQNKGKPRHKVRQWKVKE